LVRARQRRHAVCGVERKRVARTARVELIVQILQLRCMEGPVVQRALQRTGDVRGEVSGLQVARDHGQLTVARAILEGGEFHVRCMKKGCADGTPCIG